MQPELARHYRFTGLARLEKSVNSLLGIVEGIAIDGRINQSELAYLHAWLYEHRDLRGSHPFNEFVPIVEAAVADGILDAEERADIEWLCEQLAAKDYFDRVTADLQRLHAILGGVVADEHISEHELRGLSDWMDNHAHLKACWPFDEIGSLITSTLADGRIDETEHEVLKNYFSEFVALLDGRTVVAPPLLESGAISGLCAVNPEIRFDGRVFCFTGVSSRGQRRKLQDTVRQLGGSWCATPSARTDYLVIGAEGNPCWAFACYGRKVEKAVRLRKKGARLVLLHELDFHDAVADAAA